MANDGYIIPDDQLQDASLTSFMWFITDSIVDEGVANFG